MPGGGDSTETKGTATGGAVAAEGGCRRDGAESRDLAPRSLWLASTGAHAPGCVMCVCVSTVRAECGMRVASRRFRSAVTITRVDRKAMNRMIDFGAVATHWCTVLILTALH